MPGVFRGGLLLPDDPLIRLGLQLGEAEQQILSVRWVKKKDGRMADQRVLMDAMGEVLDPNFTGLKRMSNFACVLPLCPEGSASSTTRIASY